MYCLNVHRKLCTSGGSVYVRTIPILCLYFALYKGQRPDQHCSSSINLHYNTSLIGQHLILISRYQQWRRSQLTSSLGGQRNLGGHRSFWWPTRILVVIAVLVVPRIGGAGSNTYRYRALWDHAVCDVRREQDPANTETYLKKL